MHFDIEAADIHAEAVLLDAGAEPDVAAQRGGHLLVVALPCGPVA
jgi:hypothetical protein